MAEHPRPFVTLFTRCYKRPKALAVCNASVELQSVQDYQRVFIVDEIGRGLEWADAQFYERRHEALGRYVYMLDDDNILAHANVIEKWRWVTTLTGCEVMMFKAGYADLGILPQDDCWMQPPAHGRISPLNALVSRELFLKHIDKWRGAYVGDFEYLQAVMADETASIVWLDDVMAYCQRRSYGKPEEDDAAI